MEKSKYSKRDFCSSNAERDEEPSTSCNSSILGNVTFDMLSDKVSPQTIDAIKDMGFSHLTDIQSKSIPHLLLGSDVNGAAKTGSGKTLAFLIPAIELLLRHNFTQDNGTGCIVLSPTRELAQQTGATLYKLLKYHKLTYGLVIGGTKKETEASNIKLGLNIIIATPGRLLDQLQTVEGFVFSNLKMLIIDEADRLLDMGFEVQIKQIVSILPKKRQTALFSATPTTKTEDLVRISLKSKLIYVGVDDDKQSATVHGLQQGYIICPPEKRFLLLFTLLKKNRNKKLMVFFKTYKSVKFYDALLNHIGLPVKAIYGKMKQNKRTAVFNSFITAKKQILLCTDVAARGLDIPAVDWIVQYDPPDDHKEYIHRVGRTARGEGGTGQALIFLQPSEKEFIFILKQAKVTVSEFDFSLDDVVDITPMIIETVSSSPELYKQAKLAFKTYIKGYRTTCLKKIFDVAKLDVLKIGLSYGLTNPPHIKL